VALIEHERHPTLGIKGATLDNLEQDAEQLERIGRADDEVVVGVEAGVEVERPEPAKTQQLRNDELDVGSRCMVAGVETHERTVAQGQAVGVGRTPVRNIGVIERGLEKLVLEHQPLVLGDV
jgi:hypothetical protein